MITPAAVEALKIVDMIVSQFGKKLVLIGAAVPHILAVSANSRTTRDIDAVVEANGWQNFQQIREQLFGQGFRQGPAPHNFRFNEVEIDLIPFGNDLIENDQLVWPETKMVMSTLGLEEAFECAITKEVAPNFSISVVSIAGLVLLKIIAYMDRPEQRARDLQDIIDNFEHYNDEQSYDERFNLTGLVIDEVEITYEETGAYIIGSELAKIAKPKSRSVVAKFLAAISDEYARAISQILQQEGRTADQDKRRRTLYRLFRVFSAAVR
jgi:predicted nucleotidyltransferase